MDNCGHVLKIESHNGCSINMIPGIWYSDRSESISSSKHQNTRDKVIVITFLLVLSAHFCTFVTNTQTSMQDTNRTRGKKRDCPSQNRMVGNYVITTLSPITLECKHFSIFYTIRSLSMLYIMLLLNVNVLAVFTRYVPLACYIRNVLCKNC